MKSTGFNGVRAIVAVSATPNWPKLLFPEHHSERSAAVKHVWALEASSVPRLPMDRASVEEGTAG